MNWSWIWLPQPTHVAVPGFSAGKGHPSCLDLPGRPGPWAHAQELRHEKKEADFLQVPGDWKLKNKKTKKKNRNV